MNAKLMVNPQYVSLCAVLPLLNTEAFQSKPTYNQSSYCDAVLTDNCKMGLPHGNSKYYKAVPHHAIVKLSQPSSASFRPISIIFRAQSNHLEAV